MTRSEICSYCGSKDIVTDGEVICRNCGTVLGPVYRYNYYQLTASPYAPSVIDLPNRRLNKINQRIFYATYVRDRHYRLLRMVCSRLRLPSHIQLQAWDLYMKYKDEDEGTVENHVVLCVALLYQLRKSRYPLRPQNVLNVFGVKAKPVNKMAMDLGINFAKAGVPKAEDYLPSLVESVVSKFGSGAYGVNYKQSLLGIAQHILRQMPPNKRHITPYYLSVCTIYISDRNIARHRRKKQVLTHSSIAMLTGTRQSTIRDHLSFRMKLSAYERENRESLWKLIEEESR